MRKLIIVIIIVLTSCFFQCRSVTTAEPCPRPPALSLPFQNDQVTLEAYADAVRGFQLYSSLLQDCKQAGFYQIPLHGKNRADALAYLTAGFDDDMALAIIDECTQWNEELQSLVIVPGDGIPLLTTDDINKISVKNIGTDIIIFERKYTDCYACGDEYVFGVTLRHCDSAWKISALCLTAITEPLNERT